MRDRHDQVTIDMWPDQMARSSDPQTSHMAANRARELAYCHRQAILETLSRAGPLGKDGIAARSRLNGVAVCRRTVELQRAGLIRWTGRLVPSTSGRKEREWALA